MNQEQKYFWAPVTEILLSKGHGICMLKKISEVF